jgi:hypothetical protein
MDAEAAADELARKVRTDEPRNARHQHALGGRRSSITP